jgi:hypothetical protein
MAIGGQYLEIGAQIFLESLGLGGRLNDEKVG